MRVLKIFRRGWQTMKRTAWTRLVCFGLIFVMVLLGMHVNDMDSSSSSDTFASYFVMSFERVGNELPAEVVASRKSIEQVEGLALESVSNRATSSARSYVWVFFALLFGSALTLCSSDFFSSFASDDCTTACMSRILRYIHHKDGKKAYFLFV